MTIRLGLTGSIGMGKSTTAQMFADLGCAIWDADAAVHRLYAVDGAAVPLIGAIHSQAIHGGCVDRTVLKRWIATDPSALEQIEAIVHPLVQQDRADFIAQQAATVTVCDIPLLFETGAEQEFHATACVSADAATQKARVLARPGMTEAHYQKIIERQMPTRQKIAKADYIIPTFSMEKTRTKVKKIYRSLIERFSDA